MALLKKIKGSSLTETVIAMTLSLFLFSFMGWFIVQINQNKARFKDQLIYQILLTRNNTIDKLTKANNLKLEIVSSSFEGDNKLDVECVFIKDERGKVLYQTQFWNIASLKNEVNK